MMEALHLAPWDGTTPNSYHRYPVESSSHPLFVEQTTGTIYYRNDTGRMEIWCPASRLRGHLHRLFQLGVIKS